MNWNFTVLAKNPDLSVAEITTEISKRWKNLSLEEKGFYKDIAIKKCNNLSQATKPNQIVVDLEEKEKNKKISIKKSLEIESSEYKRKVKEIF